jgi:hypothetical protein
MKQLGSVLGRSFDSRDRKGGDFSVFPPKLKRREMPLNVQTRALTVTH